MSQLLDELLKEVPAELGQLEAKRADIVDRYARELSEVDDELKTIRRLARTLNGNGSSKPTKKRRKETRVGTRSLALFAQGIANSQPTFSVPSLLDAFEWLPQNSSTAYIAIGKLEETGVIMKAGRPKTETGMRRTLYRIRDPKALESLINAA